MSAVWSALSWALHVFETNLLVRLFVAAATFVPIWLAYKHEKDLRAVEGNLATLVDKKLPSIETNFSKLESELSTRFVGTFPEYVSQISDLINKAHHELIIACDYPGYCIFSDHQRWLEYEVAIAQVLDRRLNDPSLSVRIAWLDRSGRQTVLKQQFNPLDVNASDDKWKGDKDSLTRKRLRIFIGNYSSDKELTHEAISYAQFAELVEREHAAIVHKFNSVTPCEIRKSLHIYFWIADQESAIFAIPNYTARDQGLAFRTNDDRIIRGLTSIIDRLQKDA